MARRASGGGDEARIDALWADGRHAEAIALAERAVRREPRQAELRFRLGSLYAETGRTAEGAAELERAVALDPRSVGARHNLGNACRELGRLDEAERLFVALCAEHPSFAAAWHGLGLVRQARGDPDGALAATARATACEPGFAPAWSALGDLHEAAGRPERAIAAWSSGYAIDRRPDLLRKLAIARALHGPREAALALLAAHLRASPADALCAHLRDALAGATPARPPDAFVEELFDRYADRFDRHLVGVLAYRAPELVADALEADGPGARFERALDLGCGTGLAGVRLAGRCGRLVGVDLSGKMLAIARDRGIYAELHVAEALAWLGGVQPGWDLVLAVDVLGYVGALDPLFAEVGRRLAGGGRFAFTTETSPDGRDLALGPTGRYAHAAAAVRRALERAGLAVRAETPAMLREEGGRPVDGAVWICGTGA